MSTLAGIPSVMEDSAKTIHRAEMEIILQKTINELGNTLICTFNHIFQCVGYTFYLIGIENVIDSLLHVSKFRTFTDIHTNTWDHTIQLIIIPFVCLLPLDPYYPIIPMDPFNPDSK